MENHFGICYLWLFRDFFRRCPGDKGPAGFAGFGSALRAAPLDLAVPLKHIACQMLQGIICYIILDGYLNFSLKAIKSRVYNLKNCENAAGKYRKISKNYLIHVRHFRNYSALS
jgi:hypothetical protein